MTIEGWIGRPGAGKTWTLTARALRARRRGQPVYSNYPIDGCWLFGPDDLLHLPPGLIVIDEAHIWFPARQAMRLPPSWLAMLSQTRKNGWDLIWSAQHEARVDRVLRDVTSWMYLTTAWFGPPGRPRWFRTQQFEPEEFRRAGKAVATRWQRRTDKISKSYDTYNQITVAQHAQRDDDVYASTGGGS